MTYRILSCDGGGIRGLLTAVLLERIEAAIPGFVERAHMIAGTSTGGILAIGLAAGMSPTQLRALYYDHGAEIFDSSWLREIESIDGATGSKYDNKALRVLLTKTFGTATLGGLGKDVVVPTFDLSAPAWRPRFMHNLGGSDDSSTLAVDACLRTSAAPTFFPSYSSFIDGGCVANDPSAHALGRALDPETGPQAKLEDVRLLSLGTGVANQFIPGADHDWGAAEWVSPLVNLLLDANESSAEILCRQLLGPSRYRRLSPVLPSPAIPLDAWKRRDDLVTVAEKADLTELLAWLAEAWK